MNIEQQSSWRPINAERVSKHTKTTQKPTPKALDEETRERKAKCCLHAPPSAETSTQTLTSTLTYLTEILNKQVLLLKLLRVFYSE